MSSRSLFMIATLFLSLLLATTHAKHAPSTHCNVYDILEDCKDKVYKMEKGNEKNLGELDQYLIQECKGMSGLIVAKCLMKYLCINHGEDAVDRVDVCVRDVCPLAKRLPKKLCHKRQRRLGDKDDAKATFVENVLER